MNYLDFDLTIEKLPLPSTTGAPATYRARVLNSPAGQATVDFTLPFNAHELENYILKMGRPRRQTRSLTQEGEAARELGARLYNAIFQQEVRDALRRSLDAADAKPDQGLRLRLRLGDAPALLDLPWEYLYDPALRRFFCHSVATPLVRYPEQPRPVTPLTVTLPLQVLVMIANPSDVSTLDVEGEWQKIEAALAPLVAQGQVQLTRLPNATVAALQRQLRRGAYHIFHFVGHGGVSPINGERVLYLEDERGSARLVSGDVLGTLLNDHRSLRLGLLNACEGARMGTSDPFAGVAQHLVLQGIPAIIAMQFEITDDAAILLAQEFYAALADGYPVEAALAEARKAIFVAGHDVEWGTPVLYSRASDGHLFSLNFINPIVEFVETQKLGAYETNSTKNQDITKMSKTIHSDEPLDVNSTLPGSFRSEVKIKEISPDLDILSVFQDDIIVLSDLDDLIVISAKEQLGYDFRISKYPVTNYQFRRFVESGGYTDNRWWNNSDGRQYRDRDKWQYPRYWNDARFNQMNQPVVGISWYEANAYCAWLTVEWQASNKIRSNEQVRLPTQEEWMTAARGVHFVQQPEANDYPWNAPFDLMYANTRESAIGCTTPVNKYPKGCTVDGVWDMSGNVWEWTAEMTKDAIGYVKGGSWWSDKGQALVSTTGKVSRWLRHNYYGLRIAIVDYPPSCLDSKTWVSEDMTDQEAAENFESNISATELKVRQPHYQRRETVSHPKFGVGTVIASEITSDDEEVTIAFPGIGIKKFAVSLAKLEKYTETAASKERQTQYKRRDTVQHERFGVGTVVESRLTSNDEEVTIAFPGVGIKRLSVSMGNLKKL